MFCTMSPVISLGLLLLCTVFSQASPSPGGGRLMKVEEDSDEVVSSYIDPINDVGIPGVCFVCKKIITMTKKKLNGDNVKEHVANKLNSICDAMKFIKTLCRTLVNKYKDKLIDAIANKIDAESVCSDATEPEPADSLTGIGKV
ncbi:hypothetical protein DPEC_G00317120 [Dallia pectoralis]|uniref:Uncharacterized protein n=1 Tax=Dallia pectoralis TaxID=75939 RepID=A0ACC2FD32_DALPE|nr:hypothetical protein DPEC_G00317120 [Dallia pectoralis]